MKNKKERSNTHIVWNAARWTAIIGVILLGMNLISYIISNYIVVVVVGVILAMITFTIVTTAFQWLAWVFPFWGYVNLLELKYLSQQKRFRINKYQEPEEAKWCEVVNVAGEFNKMLYAGEHLYSLPQNDVERRTLRYDLQQLIVLMEQRKHVATGKNEIKNLRFFTEAIDYVNREYAKLESYSPARESIESVGFKNIEGGQGEIVRDEAGNVLRFSFLVPPGIYQILDDLEQITSELQVTKQMYANGRQGQQSWVQLEQAALYNEITILNIETREAERILLSIMPKY